MKNFVAVLIVGPLMLIGIPHAGAGQTPPTAEASIPVRLTQNNSSASRGAFTKQARADVEAWKMKLQAAVQQSEVEGKALDAATANGLTNAWTRADAASRKLRMASEDGWDGARASYVTAAQDMKAAWQKIHPDDK